MNRISHRMALIRFSRRLPKCNACGDYTSTLRCGCVVCRSWGCHKQDGTIHPVSPFCPRNPAEGATTTCDRAGAPGRIEKAGHR
jgi:hypothetical protein